MEVKRSAGHPLAVGQGKMKKAKTHGKHHMRPISFLPILLLFLSGCVSGQIKPSLGSLYKMKKVAVVAMEAQPLEITTMSSKLTKDRVKDEPSFDDLITKDGTWAPTMMLAKEAAKDLMATGTYAVILDPTLKKYPALEDRSRTFFLATSAGRP